MIFKDLFSKAIEVTISNYADLLVCLRFISTEKTDLDLLVIQRFINWILCIYIRCSTLIIKGSHYTLAASFFIVLIIQR